MVINSNPDDLTPPENPVNDTVKGSGLGGGGGNNLIWSIGACGVAIVLMWILVSSGLTGAMTQTKFDERISLALSDMEQVKAEAADAVSGVSGAVNTQITAATNSLQNSIDSLQTQINNAITNGVNEQDVTNINASIERVRADITAYEQSTNQQLMDFASRISDIELQLSPEGTPNISTKVTLLNNSLVASSGNICSANFQVEITNNSAVDANNIILSVMMATEPLSFTNVTMISSPSILWVCSGWVGNSAIYKNMRGLSVNAGKKLVLYMVLTFTNIHASYIQEGGYMYQVEAEIVK